MVWPFNKKPPRPPSSTKLAFKSGEAFFEYQCRFGVTDIKRKQGLVGLVLDATKEFGINDAKERQPDGTQRRLIKVVSQDGGFIVVANTPTNKGDILRVGDVVIWVPLEYVGNIITISQDKRIGWVGLIMAKVQPQIDMTKEGFTIICRYD